MFDDNYFLMMHILMVPSSLDTIFTIKRRLSGWPLDVNEINERTL